jgi:hypothetical protein
MKPCGYCGEDFTPTYTRRKYCSDVCVAAAKKKSDHERYQVPARRDAVLADSKRWREENPEAYSRNMFSAYLQRRYKMTLDDYYRLLDEQDGCCATCGLFVGEAGRLAVDHDHNCCPTPAQSCGKCNRGLLCMKCNTRLGTFKDDVVLLRMIGARLDTCLGLDGKVYLAMADYVELYNLPNSY